ncbi:YicC/YloC family endoribonuclease [candidate division KSB1 bacterium]
MLASMTGFGRCELTENGCRIVVEARSLNNRFLDIYVKMPRRFGEFEDDIKSIVRDELSRGKIDISLNIEGLSDSIEKIAINIPLARQYFDAVSRLGKEFNREIELRPEHLMQFDEIFEKSVSEQQSRIVRDLILKTLKGALHELKKHKSAEGKNITKDCRMRLERISRSVKDIRKQVKIRRSEDYDNLKNRIVRLIEDIEKVDPRRLEMEVAVMAEKFDVSEECVRLESHLKLFREAITVKGPVGRKLDFILQEINREANTISAKSNNFDISENVVRIKEEVERLKEQVRNVE